MTRVLLIGGTDSSGGAGMTRDTIVASDHACLAKPVVTCVTAQTNSGVDLVQTVPAHVVAAQISAAYSDTPPLAIKIGMVGQRETAKAIAHALNKTNVPVVFDPVLRASTGAQLSDADALNGLLAQSTLVTPNLSEASRLAHDAIATNDDDIRFQADILRQNGAQAVLIKGGHASGANCCDHLFDGSGHVTLCAPRLPVDARGTGCTLSTAIACELALGRTLSDACRAAKAYVQRWLNDQT